MKRSTHGLTLAQILFALFLTGIFMALTARLFRDYNFAIQHLRAKDHQLQLVHHTLKHVTGEISESFDITPTAMGVRLHKRDPLGPVPPPPHPISPVPHNYEPNSSLHRVRVDYTFNDRTLTRQTIKSLFIPGGGAQSQVVAERLDGFSVTGGGRAFEVAITVLQKRRVVTLTSQAYLWRDAP